MTGVSGKDRQLNIKRSKAANAGFSLVELLIAVTILAIIVIPLLHMFVTSTRINVKSRQTLRATTVAQDIMEGLKAYTLDEVRTQFSLPDGSISSDYFYPTEGFYIVNSKMIQGGVREIKELEPWIDGDGNVIDSNNPENEIYYFGIENLKMQGGEYDALIKLDASTYTKAKAGSSGHDNAFNGKFYADTKSVSETSGNAETDSSYHEDSNLNKYALENIKGIIKDEIEAAGGTVPEGWDEITEWAFPNSAGVPDSDKLTLMNRTIKVVLEEAKDNFGNIKTDAEGNPECKAAITITYNCEYKGKAYESNGRFGAEVKDVPRTFSSGNFYLFYYPIYSTTATIDNIQFVINDPAKLFDEEHPLLKSITLAKQIRSVVDTDANIIAPDMSNSDLYAAESSYKAKVELSKTGLGSLDSDKLLFRTNIDTYLAKDPVTGLTPDDTISGIQYLEELTANIVPKDMVGDNVSDKVTDVIYDIEITVYKTGAAENFDKYNTPGFDNIEGVQRLATITNLD